MNNFHICST